MRSEGLCSRMNSNTGQEVMPPPLLQPSPSTLLLVLPLTPHPCPHLLLHPTSSPTSYHSFPSPSFRCHAHPAQLTARGVSVSGESTMLIFNPALSLLTTKVWAMDKLGSPVDPEDVQDGGNQINEPWCVDRLCNQKHGHTVLRTVRAVEAGRSRWRVCRSWGKSSSGSTSSTSTTTTRSGSSSSRGRSSTAVLT
jgi:hypothetical protein